MSAITRFTTACAAITLTTALAIASKFEVTSSTVDAGGFWMDGSINICPSDIDGRGGSGPDGVINQFDLLLLLDNWGTSGAGAAVVVLFDLLGMLDAWGACEKSGIAR